MNSLCNVAFWNRSQWILASGVLPFCNDMLEDLSSLNDVEINKSGQIEYL